MKVTDINSRDDVTKYWRECIEQGRGENQSIDRVASWMVNVMASDYFNELYDSGLEPFVEVFELAADLELPSSYVGGDDVQKANWARVVELVRLLP